LKGLIPGMERRCPETGKWKICSAGADFCCNSLRLRL